MDDIQQKNRMPVSIAAAKLACNLLHIKMDKQKFWLVVIVAGLCAMYIYYLFSLVFQSQKENKSEILNPSNRTAVISLLQSKFRRAIKFDKGTGCKIPRLPPYSSDIAWTYKQLNPLNCNVNGEDWVKCYHSKCRIVDSIKATVNEITCEYRDIIYLDDFHYTLGEPTIVKDGGSYTLAESDHVSVNCTGNKLGYLTFQVSGWQLGTFNETYWKGNTLGFRPVSPPPLPLGNQYNVVILGFDSTSRSGFIRLMPRSWKVLNEELNATVMEGYNILGDGTPFTLFPLLTGKTELEQPDVRRNMENNRTMDDFPFIFKKLKEDGFHTAYFEDMPLEGTFQYRFNGFKHQPTDHYLRAFFDANSHLFAKWNFCYGDTPQYTMMMNITEQFLELGGRRFIFTFIGDITHDDFNNIQLADDDTAAFLRRLKKRTEDTLIIVMGDHGPRYADARKNNTLRGKLDERLPLMAIRLPSRLTRARPDALSALEANAHVLTTPHDLHATILDVLNMRRYWNPYIVPGADIKRGLTWLEPSSSSSQDDSNEPKLDGFASATYRVPMATFRVHHQISAMIPSNRSCSEAGIETHWCSCLVWQNVALSDPLYKRTAAALINHINLLIKDAGSQCIPRSIATIGSVSRQRPNTGLLSFTNSMDYECYLGAFNSKTQVDIEKYQIAVEANPGGAAYEATLTYNTQQDKLVVHSRDISRVNSYHGESDCIRDTHPHLAPYCYCKR